MTAHTCHADGCNVVVPPRLLMCPPHWRMVPRRLQSELWAVYVPGQEVRKDPTGEYLAVARRCIDTVAAAERGQCEPAECPHADYLTPDTCSLCKGTVRPHGAVDEPDLGPVFTARFPGRCRGCAFDISPGEPIRARDGVFMHEGCAD